MYGFSLSHLLVLLVVVLLFGAKRLPELGRALGSGVHAFKKGLEGESYSQERLSSTVPSALRKGTEES